MCHTFICFLADSLQEVENVEWVLGENVTIATIIEDILFYFHSLFQNLVLITTSRGKSMAFYFLFVM